MSCKDDTITWYVDSLPGHTHDASAARPASQPAAQHRQAFNASSHALPAFSAV